uniref:Uncharacterized protein n=1 Tax=Schistocephalus solidus TaxID=70667 RepID=A0A0X3PMC0_SCHSO
MRCVQRLITWGLWKWFVLVLWFVSRTCRSVYGLLVSCMLLCHLTCPFNYAGASCPYDKLDAVREQQEELMRLHFALDNKVQNVAGSTSTGNRRQARRYSNTFFFLSDLNL